MTDWENIEDAGWFGALVLDGWPALICVIIALIAAFAYCNQSEVCGEKSCANGAVPTIVKGECVCMTRAQ